MGFQSVKVSVPVKQETSKGVKRPHSSDSAEVPKVVTRLVACHCYSVIDIQLSTWKWCIKDSYKRVFER